MKRLLLLLLIATPAQADELADLTAIKFRVDISHSYARYTGDHRPADLSDRFQNCVGYSRLYAQKAAEAGYSSQPVTCWVTPTVEAYGQEWPQDPVLHRYTRVGQWALDNRHATPIKLEDEDCK